MSLVICVFIRVLGFFKRFHWRVLYIAIVYVFEWCHMAQCWYYMYLIVVYVFAFG